MNTTTCERCGHEIELGEWPMCPHGRQTSFNVQPDGIPGGVLIKHGLCNEDGTPRRYYSRTEIAAEAKKRGLMNYVVHEGGKGSDKSKNTVRWI